MQNIIHKTEDQLFQTTIFRNICEQEIVRENVIDRSSLRYRLNRAGESTPPCLIVNGIGETGASCYNFHSNSIFQKNMQARDIFLDVIV